MANIQIRRTHSLDNTQIHDKVNQLAERLQEEYAVESLWEGERLIFRRTGASGYLQLHDGEIELQIKLNLLLSPLKGHIEQTVQDYLDERLV